MAETPADAALRQLNAGRFEQAALGLSRALARAPGDATLNSLMCRALASQGQFPQAEFYIARAASARPDDADILNDLGNCLAMLGGERTAQAAQILQRAVAADPGHLGAAVSLAGVLNTLHRPMAALRHCEGAAARFAFHPPFAVAHAAALLGTARAADAAALLRGALAHAPGHAELLARLAFTLNYVPGAPPAEVSAAHRAAGGAIRQAAPPCPPLPVVVRHPDRPVRIGLLSPDLRTHSVAYFVRPVLEFLDRRRFQTLCYSDCPPAAEDTMSARLRLAAAQWRNVAGLSDPALAARIRADGVDVLIELTGYTGRNRLGALALRPARTIVSYCGYPNTTGLDSVDFRIVDSLTDPPGAESLATERLLRLDPCFLCYMPPEQSPPVSEPPAATRGHITFGCFNAVTKINPPLLALWGRVLSAVPGSRLLLKAAGLDEPALASDLLFRADAAGLPADRVDIRPYSASQTEHLAAYSGVDIALDTFPYHGTTTTCEALHMGVPVVSLTGAAHASRVGRSLLSAVGLSDLAADDEMHYVRAAKTLAADGPRLRELRQDLRNRLHRSPLGDGAALGRRLGVALAGLASRRTASVLLGSTEPDSGPP